MNKFVVLGKILSHGYLCCGFLPTRLSFPILAYSLLGPSVSISRDIFMQSLSDFVSAVDRRVIITALSETEKFTEEIKSNLVNVISRFGCRDIPTPVNLKDVLFGIARHQFKSQPFASLSSMNSGVPVKHRPFWQAMDVEEFYALFTALTASPEKVLNKIEDPAFQNENERRVYTYLRQYIGEMKIDEVKRFLRYVTGSSVVQSDKICIVFNGMSGIARRPSPILVQIYWSYHQHTAHF